ncbi:MAG: photosystem reaction center subunit H, partial [Cyanobacteria bacterium P01_G01_bin.19]
LGTGEPLRQPIAAPPMDTREPVMEERWDEDEWQESRTAPVRQQAEAIPYEDEYEENNWEDAEPAVYDAPVYEAPPVREYEDASIEDVWDDDIKGETYNPPPINIPQKEKAPEYEEEPG